ALPAGLEKRLELHRDVEVILDRVLAAPGDQDDVVDTRGDSFLDAVLDDWFVDERKHLLGLGFGCGKKPRAQARGGKDSFADYGRHTGIVAEESVGTAIEWVRA